MRPDIPINGIVLDGESYTTCTRAEEIFHSPENIRYFQARTGEILLTLLTRRESQAQRLHREWCAGQSHTLKTTLESEFSRRGLPLTCKKKSITTLIALTKRRINFFIQPPFLSSPILLKEEKRWQKPTGTTAVALHLDKKHTFQKLRRWGHNDEDEKNKHLLNLFGVLIEEKARDKLPSIMPLLAKGDPAFGQFVADAIDEAFRIISMIQDVDPKWYVPILPEKSEH